MVNVLFVCLGNICRSPSAEAVMNSLLRKRSLSDKIKCDSAGIIDYHKGEPADSRMQKHAARRGFDLTSISRPVKPDDFNVFDYIIAMDNDNMSDLNSFPVSAALRNKISKMTDYNSSKFDNDVVPDPYYGGAAGFELVLDLLEDACEGLLEHIISEHPEVLNE